MDRFLRSLLNDLVRRAAALEERVEAIDTDENLELRELALLAYQYLERVRRNADQLARDPTLGNPQLVKNQIQLYKRWSEILSLVEWYPVPFIERYNERDRKLTALCRRLAGEVRWPLPLPVVAGFSTQYFWTKPEFNLIAVPADEGSNLLTLPDLCHELGHILLLYYREALVGDFLEDLAGYFQKERQKIDTQQRSPAHKQLIEDLFALWNDVWIWEFASDMVAVYLVGAPYGWQHLRLYASLGASAYFPSLGDFAEHPADEARMRGILSVLRQVGSEQWENEVRLLWEQYLSILGEDEPQDYALCYPPHLIERLAANVVTGCEGVGLNKFTDREDSSQGIVSLIDEGWKLFLQNPQVYNAWQRKALAAVFKD